MNTHHIWIDGNLMPAKKAVVPFLTHSLHYGSAVFEGIRFYQTETGPAVFRLDEHLKRLMYSAETMGMKVPFSKRDIADAIATVIRKNKLTSGYIRPLIWYGERMGLSVTAAPVHVGIAAWAWGKYLHKEAVSVELVTTRRIAPSTADMGAKVSGHYFNSILASIEAAKKGKDEGLLLDVSGAIAEGPGENIFFVKGKTLYTPRLGTILSGITRDSIITLARDQGYTVKEATIKPGDMKKFDEAFFVGTAAEVNAIASIGNITFNKKREGEVTRILRETYAKVVRGKLPKYKKWLTRV